MIGAEYRRKKKSPEEAVSVVRSGHWVDYGMGLTMPVSLDRALALRVGEVEDVKIRGILALRPIAAIEADRDGRSFSYSSWHLSGYERRLADRGLCLYRPMVYRNLPRFYRQELAVDVAFLQVTPMDRHGFFNFSLSNSASSAICEKASVVIVEVNEGLPRALGGFGESIHIGDVDIIVEGDALPPGELPPTPADETDRRIAEIVVDQIPDGATLQLGIGGLPNAIGHLLAQSDRRDLAMHTEMLCDAYLELHRAGKLTNRRKANNRGKGVWTFAAGSKDLYDWIDGNSGLASCPVDYTNDPDVIASQKDMISVNSCLEVDLFGQISSESSRFRQISGTGGQLDFLEGTFKAPEGRAFICLPSTFTDAGSGQRRSRIVADLERGTIVTAPRSTGHLVVTEWGMANLAGRSLWERAEALISIAHPDFRDDLVEAAGRSGIWRPSNRQRP